MASRLRVRLHRLERTAQGALPSGQDGEPGEPRTEAEWIDRTGELLWRVNLGGRVANSPITYLVDGEQQVSVAAGNSLYTFGLRQ